MLFCFFSLITMGSCVSRKTIDIENYVHLYEIINSECHVPQDEFDPCKYTLFFGTITQTKVWPLEEGGYQNFWFCGSGNTGQTVAVL